MLDDLSVALEIISQCDWILNSKTFCVCVYINSAGEKNMWSNCESLHVV